MSPVDQVRRLYFRHPQPRTFEEDLQAHLANGYVFSTPEAFMMGRPISRDAEWSLQVDPFFTFRNPDTWLVWAASSVSVNMLLTFVPFHLRWVAWSRRGKALRFYPFDRLCATITHSKADLC